MENQAKMSCHVIIISKMCLYVLTQCLVKYHLFRGALWPGPEVIKHFSCSAQLRLKFILLINVKMPTIVGILTFMSRINH